MYSVVLIEERTRKIVKTLATGFENYMDAWNFEDEYASKAENKKEAFANGWLSCIIKEKGLFEDE